MNNPASSATQRKVGNLRRRYARERRFAAAGILSILVAALFLGGLLVNVGWKGWRGFFISEVQVQVVLPQKPLGNSPRRHQKLISAALLARFPDAQIRADKKALRGIVGLGAALRLRDYLQNNPSVAGQTIVLWLPAGGHADSYFKGGIDHETMLSLGGSAAHIERLQSLRAAGDVRVSFNAAFFTAGDSSYPELAGIGGALAGSFYTLLIAFLLSFPTGVLASIYLEMFAPRNRWFDLIEININNLAAVPSVIFGLLGLAVFINIFGAPRSAPFVGGLVLSLMTLPTIIIASRSALRAVPPSLLAAAMSLGATRMQGVFHHVLPAAMPGVLTGAIIGMAQALGETAPLLLIGMVAFVNEVPSGFWDSATALPVQIYLWADNPIRGFAERAAAAIITLLAFLALMNVAAVILRSRLETKW